MDAELGPPPSDGAPVQVTSDTPTQRRHRAHQSWWRHAVLGLPAGSPAARAQRKNPTLGNYLPQAHGGQTAAEAGWNLMSDAARDYTRRRLDVLRRTDGLAETDRLWRNMLSSQPLAFSIAGQLRAHPDAAATVFAELTGLPVVGLDRLGEPSDDYLLDGLEAEWSPPRAHHTGDRSGFDVAALLRLEDGSRLLVSVEVKYVDSFSPAVLELGRYHDHLTAIGLDDAATAAIVASGASQFLRSVLLTESVRRAGLRGESSIEHSLAAVLGREDDRTADSAVDVVARHAPHVQVARWSHTQLFTAAGHQPVLAEWARQMGRRYVL